MKVGEASQVYIIGSRLLAHSKDNTYGRHTKNLQSRETDLATPISSQLIAGIVHDLNLDHDYEKKILSLLQSESQILCIAHEL